MRGGWSDARNARQGADTDEARVPITGSEIAKGSASGVTGVVQAGVLRKSMRSVNGIPIVIAMLMKKRRRKRWLDFFMTHEETDAIDAGQEAWLVFERGINSQTAKTAGIDVTRVVSVR